MLFPSLVSRGGRPCSGVADVGAGGKHQEINASEDEKLECVLMRSDSEAIAINLPDLEPVEKPENVKVSGVVH